MKKIVLFLLFFFSLSLAFGQTINYEDNNGPVTLSQGNSENGKNTYSGMDGGFTISVEWSGSRWEIFIEGPGVSRYVAFFSNENTALDPPNFTVGNWVDAEPPSGDPNAPTGDGTSLVAFSGSGTTNMVIAGCTDAAAPQINCPSIPGTEEVTLSFLTAFAPQTYNWTITETSGSMSQVAQGSVELTQAGIAGTAMPSLTCGQDYDVVITFSGTAPNAFTVTISGVEVITAGNVTSNDGVVNNGSSFTFSVPNCAGSTDFEVDNDAGMCSAMVSNLIATATDDCTANPTITHTITGATSGGGGDNASGIFNVGTSTVTFTAEDDENKMNTCSFDVIVSDTENPTASNPAGINVSCPEAVPAADPAVVTTEMDNCSAIVAFVEDTDNGGSGCMGSPLIITREYSVSDPSSNSISVFQTITVEDNTPPTASNPAPVNVSCFGDIPANDPTIVMDEMDNCTAGIVVAYVTDISNGGLGSGTDPFIITRTYRVTDCNGNGNSIDVTQTITVSDSEKPMVTCPGDVMQQVDAGETFATVNNIALTTSDNCAASPTVTYGIGGATTVPPATPGDASGTEFNLGMSTVTYSSADAAGNINTCSFTVTVTAAPTPEIEVMANSSTLTDGVSTSDFGNVNIDGGTATTTFTISNTGTADLILDANPVSVTGSSAFNSTQPALLMIPPNGNTSFTITFNPGNNQCEFQTAAVSIASNDADEDPFNFNVEGNGVDNVNPTLTCPTPPSAVDNDPDKCSAVVNGLAPSGVNDNCTPPIVTYALTGATTGSGNNDASGEAFNVGTTTVTYTVDDGTNMVTCNFDVVVNDTEDPKIDCSAIDVTRDADADECSFTMPGTGFDPTFNDNCPGASISNNFNNMASLAGAEFPVGTTTVIWTVTDAATRTATCTIMIEVTDAEDPTIDCSAIDVTRDSDPDECSFTMPGTGFDPTFADNCPGASISNDFNNMSSLAGVEFPVATTTVIWTVTDAAMRTATCTIMIEVTDVEDPTITCPDAPAAVSNDPDECFAIVNGLLPLDLDDNCTPPVATYELTGATTGMGNDDASGTMFNVGTTTVTYTVSDGVNTGDCSFDVVVNDTEDPTIDCSSIMEMRDADAGECSFTMPGTGFDPAFEDNCTGASTSNDYNNMSSLAGAEFPVGTTTVIWTVTDAAMRTATCTIMIEISDAENPTISCPSNATVSNDLGVCNAVVNGIAPTSSDDNCPSPTIAYTLTGATTGSGTDDASGETFDVGTTTVTYTITDASMNTGNCSFDVTVNDGEAPNMVCNNFSVDVTDATGGVTISAGQVDGGSMDNCAIIALSATPSSFNCSTLGAQTVTLTGFDAAGNSMSCTGTITVNDATSCGCGNPQPGDMCDDADATTENDVIQANCGCIGTPICDIAITGVLSTPETCDGENDATIVINASCTTCASILYSIDGGTTTQVSNLFGNLSDGTYMPYVVDSGDPGCNDTATDEVIDPGAALPDDPIPGPATRAFCASEGLNAELDNTGIRVSNLGADEKVVWILKTAPSGSAYTADQVLTPAGCPVGFTDLGELAIASGSRVIRVEDVENALPGTYTFEAYLENCTTGCISNTVGGFSITVYAAPTVDITADPDGAICLGTTDVMYDATIMSTDGGTYSYAWCAYNATNGGGTCFGGFTPGGDNASQMRSWTSSPGAKSVGVEIMSEFPGCIASTIYNFQVVNTPPEPIADKTDGSLCVGQDAATVFVDDPGMNREIVWVILEAPAGASFAMDDELEPNVNASDYRTDLDANGRRLRIKNNAAVGTYRFKAKTRETSLGCESDPTTEEFTITVNETPAVPTIDRQDLVRCRRETATISVLPTTDVEFVWEVLEAPNGVSFAAGDRLEPGVDGSDYRTDLQADGRELRTKGSARAGLYRFKVLARDINTGCESELTADELSILINDLRQALADPQLQSLHDARIGLRRRGSRDRQGHRRTR
ncbi:MAG: HYR domain-containing protein, partial [Bacteroidota bacterium]